MEQLLSEVYYDTKSPACFSSINAVYNEAKNRNKKVTRKQVVEFLQKQPTYTKHKPARRKFARNKTVPIGLDTDWQADLCDMQKIKGENDGFAYILTCIDVLSRFAWAVPIKTKSPKYVCPAFEKILESGRKCWRLATDKGTEFLGQPFQDLLSEKDINHIIPKNEVKCAVVERYNRTLKSRLWRAFTKNRNFRWVDILPNIVMAINNSKNRITGCTPSSVNFSNATQLWLRLYGKPKQVPDFKFNIGDNVRILRTKSLFEKGYLQNFTTEIFTVCERLNRNPPVYRIKSHNGEILQGTFYTNELVKIVKTNDIYDIEKILKTRTRKGIKELLVKWDGYNCKENSWIKASDLVSPI